VYHLASTVLSFLLHFRFDLYTSLPPVIQKIGVIVVKDVLKRITNQLGVNVLSCQAERKYPRLLNYMHTILRSAAQDLPPQHTP
jgi:GTP cyclohydrolase III